MVASSGQCTRKQHVSAQHKVQYVCSCNVQLYRQLTQFIHKLLGMSGLRETSTTVDDLVADHNVLALHL
jgi:hypothetical protein